jgi:hypothetical protein
MEAKRESREFRNSMSKPCLSRETLIFADTCVWFERRKGGTGARSVLQGQDASARPRAEFNA